MKAVRINAPFQAEYTDLPRPEIGPDQLLVRVEAVGICMSDVEILEGTRPAAYVRYPVIPGHEWCGSVVEIGANVQGFRPGDRVAVEGQNYCGACYWCRRGQTNLCEIYNEFGFTLPGGFTQYVAVRSDLAHAFSQELSFEEAALTEPAACAGHAVLRAGVRPGDTLAVVGPGTIGLLGIAWARQFEPGQIIAVGLDRMNEKLALELGASAYFTVDQDPAARIRDFTGGRGADVVLEAAGSKNAVALSLELARRGGTVVLAGIAGGDSRLPLETDIFSLKDLRVHGTFSYPSTVFADTLERIQSGHLQVRPLISHRLPLASFRQAFELLKSRSEAVVKIILTP